MLEYYFPPAGTVSGHFFQSKIKDEILDTADATTAEEAGFTDPAYAGPGYFFKTFSNFPGYAAIGASSWAIRSSSHFSKTNS